MAIANEREYRPILLLDVKRTLQKWNDEKGKYVESNDVGSETTADAKEEPKEIYAFTLIRQFVPTEKDGHHLVNEEIQLRSPMFIKAAQEVMKGRRDVAWKMDTVKFAPNEFLAFMPQFTEYVDSLEKLEIQTEEQQEIIEHVRFFLTFMQTEYHEQLEELESLKDARVVTFDLIWGVLVPGMILLTHDRMTSKPWAVRLLSLEIHGRSPEQPKRWILSCEFVAVEGDMPGLAETELTIPHFVGMKRILDLTAYPLDQLTHEEQRKKKEELIGLGKKRWMLRDWKHCYYNDIAYAIEDDNYQYRKIMTTSQIMIDGEMFDCYAPHGFIPNLTYSLDREALTPQSRRKPNDDEFLLMSPRLYGYTLGDREWLVFSVDCVNDIQWNHDVFKNLDMEEKNKEMIKSLITQHIGLRSDGGDDNGKLRESAEKFDDFVERKGLGLIFNLHGPPGVGKTLTAEAISDLSRSPLYIVGSSDLGSDAEHLERALNKVFVLAYRWKAVVLIDEADVYLERREVHDMQRNAMVSVFLRKLEYYPGILFLTTNRVSVFDDAMKSRIDVSIVYNSLSMDARERLWIAFLKKTNMTEDERYRLIKKDMKYLRGLSLNGRDIKNIVKIASAVAAHDKAHTLSTEDIMRVVTFSKEQGHIGANSFLMKVIRPQWIPYVVSSVAAFCTTAVVLGGLMGLKAYLRSARRL